MIPEKLINFRKIELAKARKRCLEVLTFIEEVFSKGYDLLVLDEMNIVLREGYIKDGEILNLIEKKPETMEMVITGRGAPESLIKRADLVSEINKIKHPYDTGIKERRGIDG